MRISVIGAKGNMGARYCAILRHLGHDCLEVDIGTGDFGVHKTDGIIIATPTETHYELINYYSLHQLPILCEKPISKDIDKVKDICKCRKINVRMINQYEYFEEQRKKNQKLMKVINIDPIDIKTSYDYYKSGSDGLIWDCLNVIGLSNSVKLELANNSPIWRCILNGVSLNISEMDYAYIWNINDWLNKFQHNKRYILEAHERAKDFEHAFYNDRDTDETCEH